MTTARFATLRLARFDTLRPSGALEDTAGPDALFTGVGADVRAAGTEPSSLTAWVFLVYGLHPSVEAARRFVAATPGHARWLGEAVESWHAVLEPFRHFGEANHLDRAGSGPVFTSLGSPPADDEPIVVVTSTGWKKEGLDMARVTAFGAGVMAVRISMTGVAGLQSQQSFFFKGVLEHDPVTVTTWRSFDAMRRWAYGPGTHRMNLERHRASPLSDRTSFTRFRILECAGTWYGDPVRG